MIPVLVDTSVWISHLRSPHAALIGLLKARLALVHSAVIGELACGNLPNRRSFLETISLLPRTTEASPTEVLSLIERHRLFGKGIGWTDAHLLASCLLTGAGLLTEDSRLHRVSAGLLKS